MSEQQLREQLAAEITRGTNALRELAAEREKVQTLVNALKALRGWTTYVRLPCGEYSVASLIKAEAKADAALAKVKGGK